MEIDWAPFLRDIKPMHGWIPVYMQPELVEWFVEMDLGPVELEGGPDLMAALPWFRHGYAVVSTIKYCLHLYQLRSGKYNREILHNFALTFLMEPEEYIYNPMIASELLTEYAIVKRAHDRAL